MRQRRVDEYPELRDEVLALEEVQRKVRRSRGTSVRNTERNLVMTPAQKTTGAGLTEVGRSGGSDEKAVRTQVTKEDSPPLDSLVPEGPRAAPHGGGTPGGALRRLSNGRDQGRHEEDSNTAGQETEVGMVPEETLEFVQRIDHDPLNLVAISHEDRVRFAQFDKKHWPDAVTWAREYNKKGWKLYYGVNVMHPLDKRVPSRGTGKDVAVLWGFPIDLDAKSPIRPTTEAERGPILATALRIIAFFRENGLGRPMLVDSGNGYQVVSVLRPPVILDDAARVIWNQRFTRLTRHLQEKFSSDEVKVDSMFDLPRVFALPGTLKNKRTKTDNYTGDRPNRVVRVLDWGDLS